MLQNGVSHRCACVKLGTKGGIAPFWGNANFPLKVSRDMGYRSDSIAVSRDTGPLSKPRNMPKFSVGVSVGAPQSPSPSYEGFPSTNFPHMSATKTGHERLAPRNAVFSRVSRA